MSATIQILALSLIAAILYAVLKKESAAIALVFALAVAVCLLAILFAQGQDALQWLAALESQTDTDAFSCLLKAAGIILCADYGRDLCKDAGSDSMANCVALTGRFLVIAAAMPLLNNVYLAIMELSR